MNPILHLWGREPVAVTAAVGALLVMLIAFGLPWSAEQKEAVVAFIAAAGVLIARSQVDPPIPPGS